MPAPARGETIETASKFEAGVEAMRERAIEQAASWHQAQWTEKPMLTAAEVHELINGICGEIRVATVQGN